MLTYPEEIPAGYNLKTTSYKCRSWRRVASMSIRFYFDVTCLLIVGLGLLLLQCSVYTRSEGSGETARTRSLVWAFAARRSISTEISCVSQVIRADSYDGAHVGNSLDRMYIQLVVTGMSDEPKALTNWSSNWSLASVCNVIENDK